jgi:FtsZ-interacting cell division protein ZipA
MNSTVYIVLVIAVLAVIGIILALIFSRRKRSQNYQAKFGTEYAHTVKTLGGEKEAQDEMDARVKHVGSLPIRSLNDAEHTTFLAEWNTIQAKFIDHPAQATIEADHLIMQVMQTRNYPISDFEQRAADVSINYPKLVSDYRAARDIAIKNEHHEATTEDLRQALIYYRSLFDELLEPEYDVVDKKYR